MIKNKNILPLKKSEFFGGVRQLPFGLVIRVESDQNVLSYIGSLCRHFNGCVFLYELGYLKIYLNPSLNITKSLDESIEHNHRKMHLEKIGSLSTFYDTFLVYVKSDREQSLLMKEDKTEYMFDLFKEEYSHKIVSAKLLDILQHSDISFDEELNQQNIINNSKISDEKSSISKVSLKLLRKISLPDLVSSYITHRTSIVIPFLRDVPVNENYPQQVSDEQNVDDRSLFLFSNGLSLPVTTDNTSGLTNDERNVSSSYSGQNTVPGEASSSANNSAAFTGTGNMSYSARGARYPNYTQYHERLASYARWVRPRPDPNTLSKAGFFFTSEN